MKSLDRTLGTLAGIFLLMIIISILAISSYSASHDISFKSLFNSPDFDTIEIEESNQFQIPKEIFVSTTIEQVIFIEEERSDVLVEYSRELPDSEFYHVKYKAEEVDDQLYITATHSSQFLIFGGDYKGVITLHIPKGQHFNKITIDSNIANLEAEHIYSNADEIKIITNIGNINFKAVYPSDKIEISSNIGSIHLSNTAILQNIYISCDSGNISIDSYNTIQSLQIENDAGSIQGTFQNFIEKANITTNIGSINVKFLDNQEMTIYMNTSVGDTSSDFKTVSKAKTNYIFTTDVGSIHINDH